MAKIVQVLTRASREYDLETAESQVRDLDAIVEKLNTTFQEELKQEVADAQVRDLDGVIQKLNTTYQQELKDEVEAQNFFLL